ncbi:MAG: SUMF1/EgtB/PvdO family nonheme iron enzyme [Pirellulaceae bacterium]
MSLNFGCFGSKEYNSQYSPDAHCPMNNVTFFDAAAYCRWLSEQAGIPEDEMCYPPIEQIGPGMSLPDNWLERSGYRLPTEAL